MCKKRNLVWVIAVVISLVTITISGCKKEVDTSDKTANRQSVSEKVEQEAAEVTEPVEEAPEENEPEYTNYIDAYKSVVQEAEDDTTRSLGYKYGALIDLEKDNIPELLLVTPSENGGTKIVVYKYANSKRTKIYEKRLGERFGQTDVSYSFGMNTERTIPCIVTFQSDGAWTTECMHVFSIEDGKAKETILLGKSAVAIGEEGFEWEDPFDYFEINGKEVDKNTFYDAYNSVCDGFVEVEVNCNVDLGYESNYDPKNKIVYPTDEVWREFLSIFGL